jgi:hypothetical protein
MSRANRMERNNHRLVEESRQVAFFGLPAVSATRPHQHVLLPGSNWMNLFEPMSGASGAASDFFRERRITWWHARATGDPRGLQGPTHNTLSSQVACVNFLLPHRQDPAALTAILRKLDPDVETVVPVEDGHMTPAALVELEWVGSRGFASLEGTGATRGQRVTSADAFLVARLHDGRLRGYLMEWKYVERGSEDDKRGGQEGETRRSRYRSLFEAVFKPGIDLDDFLIDPLYQLMRLSLLARHVVASGQLPAVGSIHTVLVCPRTNEFYRRTRPTGIIRQRHRGDAVVEAMRGGLREPDTFVDCAPSDLVAAVRALDNPPPSRCAWLSYMQSRYGW